MHKLDTKSNKNKIRDKVLNILQIPDNIFSNVSPIDFLSNKEVLIQDSKGILEYDNKAIRINIGSGIIAKFTGRNLQITSLSDKNLTITGYIASLEFLQ